MKARSLSFWLPVLILTLFAVSCAPASSMTETAAAPVREPSPTEPPLAEPSLATAVQTQEPASVEATSAPASEEAAAVPAGQALRFEIVPEQSEARYRVREQLARLPLPNDAVGVTKQISGSVTVFPDGTIDPSSQFVVDMASLETDNGRRDNYVRSNVLQTDQYPTATFVATSVSGLTFPLPGSGEVSFEMTGDLTIRDVTREVTWQVTGSIEENQAVGLATVRFTFGDFNITKPTVGSVLSIEDHIDLEIDVVIKPVSVE